MKVSEAESGKTLELAPEELLEIELAENPTTGHRWRIVESGAPALRLHADEFVSHGGGAPGAGGARRITLAAARPGKGAVALEYRRRTDRGPAPRRFTLRVVVSARP